MDSLIQNDLSSSYQVEYLTGEVTSESIGYLPQIEKQSFNSKDNNNLPMVRENFIINQPPILTMKQVKEKLKHLGSLYAANFDANLDKGEDLMDIVNENKNEDGYEEITKSNILPTSKRETKYLLGM